MRIFKDIQQGQQRTYNPIFQNIARMNVFQDKLGYQQSAAKDFTQIDGTQKVFAPKKKIVIEEKPHRIVFESPSQLEGNEIIRVFPTQQPALIQISEAPAKRNDPK